MRCRSGRFLTEEAEDVKRLRSGLKRNARCADKGKSVGEQQVASAPERARAGDRAAVHRSGDRVDIPNAWARRQRCGDRAAARKGTPPRPGAGPVSDQSKTSALAGSDAAASGSNPAIIKMAHDLVNFIRSLSGGSTGLRFTDAHASVRGSGALVHVALMTASTMGER
jgi:hypothetical protein